ncbi:MAG: GumC family protein, partial [Nitrospiria bacterium]
MDLETKKLDYQELLWDFIGIGWRRKFWILIPLLIGAAISVYLVFTLPKIYQSNTLILVEAQKVPQSIVQSAVTGTAQDRLASIKQQVLSRSFLLRIIEKFGLYQNGGASYFQNLLAKIGIEPKQKTVSTGSKIGAMRKNIEVRTNGRRRLESFSISFSGEDPETVMNVTNELASLVIEENLRIREGFIEGATDFLNVELENLKKELERQEKRFGDYKRTYMGELPEQLDANLRALDRFQANLEAIRISKKTTHDRIDDLERRYKNLSEQQARMTSDNMIDPAIGLNPIAQSPLEQTLSQYRVMLADLLIEYNDNYPDVIILKRKIEELEKKAGNIRRKTANPELREGSSDTAPQSIVSEPAMMLVTQIRSANEDLKNLVTREAEIEEQIGLYEQRVENTPKREQEMVTIQRDYDNISNSYQALLSKKLNAEISENLEKRQKGEQFRIIDPANLPEKPIKPNKFLVLLIGT